MRTPSRIGRPRQPRRGGSSLVTVAAVAVVAGLALGRSVSAGPAAPATATVAAPTSVGGSAPGSAAGPSAERLRALERAVARQPADLTALQQVGVAYVQRAAEVGDPAFYALAEQAFARADAVTVDHPATLLGRATLALGLHDFARARDIGERLHAAQPHSAEPLGVLVDAAVELGDYDAAAGHVQQMLDVAPGTAALSRASYLRQLHGDLDGALTAMRQAATAAGSATFDRAVVTALIGDLHWAGGDLAAARAAYDEAGEAAPGLPAAEVGHARVLAAEGRAEEALDRLALLVDRYPRPDALILQLELQEHLGHRDDAAATREVVRAIAVLQQDAGQAVDLELALFEADHGDPERAVELATRAHAARPDNVHAQDALAWALARAGQAAAARPHVEQALRLGTRDAATRYHAAVVLDAVGETDRAREELQAVLDSNPRFSVAARAGAAALARRLGMEVPGAWRG